MPHLQPPGPQTLKCVTGGLSEYCPERTSLPLSLRSGMARSLQSGAGIFRSPGHSYTEVLGKRPGPGPGSGFGSE